MTTNLNENASETQKILEQENEETNHAFIGFVNDLAETTDQTSKKSTELTDNNTQEKLEKQTPIPAKTNNHKNKRKNYIPKKEFFRDNSRTILQTKKPNENSIENYMKNYKQVINPIPELKWKKIRVEHKGNFLIATYENPINKSYHLRFYPLSDAKKGNRSINSLKNRRNENLKIYYYPNCNTNNFYCLNYGYPFTFRNAYFSPNY